MATSQPFLELTFKPKLSVIREDLKDLGVDLRSLREPLKRSIQQVIIPSIRANFDAGGRPKWAPYAAATLEFHEMLSLQVSKGMLVKTGALKAVATQFNIWTVTQEDAKLTGLPQTVWYGNIHQTGGKGGKGPKGIIPARPFIMFQDEDYEKITQVFAKWLDERIARRWAGR
jgi:phage virion morphogenesis protein